MEGQMVNRVVWAIVLSILEKLTWMTLLRRDGHGQQCSFLKQKKENGY